jgi:hypothetical protein
MKVVLTTQVEMETRMMLEEYCGRTKEPITQTVNDAIVQFINEKGA